jgi:hypothetical protein
MVRRTSVRVSRLAVTSSGVVRTAFSPIVRSTAIAGLVVPDANQSRASPRQSTRKHHGVGASEGHMPPRTREHVAKTHGHWHSSRQCAIKQVYAGIAVS